MASVAVLYIGDDIVGPHLELLRNICEPWSTSRPHVTVRYFERLRLPREYLDVSVDSIDLIEPGSFLNGSPKRPRTVYISCTSDDLLPLEHKPHFPSSEFHVTIYDGPSARFAKSVLQILERVPWGFRVPLPNTKLERIQIRSRQSKSVPKSRIYPPALASMFYDATKRELRWDYIAQLSERKRLDLVEAISAHLARATAGFIKVPTRPTQMVRSSATRYSPQSFVDTEVHLTPPELARSITEYAVSLLDDSDLPVDFGDPAVGTGAFFSALLQTLPRTSIASAIGIDVSPRQVAAARSRWSNHGMDVLRGDYLHMEQLPARTLILANPPYLRHQRIPSKYKQDLRTRASVSIGRRVSARSGQYVYFLLLSHAWMKKNGVAAWLIPSEFMQTSYGDAVRHYLTHDVQLIRIHQYSADDPQFEKAEVLPAVVVFRNRKPKPDGMAQLTVGGTLRAPINSEFVSVDDLRKEQRWSIPRRVTAARSVPQYRIGDLFEVRRGIATGANGFFVLAREEAQRLGIPKRALRPVLPKARALGRDIVESELDGYPRVSPQLCLVDCDLPEKEIAKRYPRFMEYLSTARRLGILERNLVRHRHPWYKQERREAAPFLCTYMGRGGDDSPPLKFIWNKSNAVATNTYLMLYPRPVLSEFLKEHPDATAQLFQLLKLTASGSMRASSRVHAGGLRKIEPKELLHVPLVEGPSWLKRMMSLQYESQVDLVETK